MVRPPTPHLDVCLNPVLRKTPSCINDPRRRATVSASPGISFKVHKPWSRLEESTLRCGGRMAASSKAPRRPEGAVQQRVQGRDPASEPAQPHHGIDS